MKGLGGKDRRKKRRQGRWRWENYIKMNVREIG
jgi:hypothetical protein